MKLQLLIVVIGVLAFFAGSGVTYKVYRHDLKEEKTLITMRRIGHEILLNYADSTSRVLPVKRINKKTFRIGFENPFAFNPDTIVNIIHNNILSSQLPQKYIVSVINCHKNEIIYGYEVINHIEDSAIPCIGRIQPVGCYFVDITFTGAQITAIGTITNVKLLSLAAIIFLSFTSWGYVKKRNKRNLVKRKESMVIGKYVFYFNERTLMNGRRSIKLSAKESKLLKVFADNRNQLLDRAKLLKEVWEDEGVFVGRSLDVFVSKLRKKLAEDTSIKIANVHGKGYKLEVNDFFSRSRSD